MQLQIRFSRNRHITNEGCWEWTGTLNNKGYGQVVYKNKKWLVHRLSFFIFKNTEYKDNLLILHYCNNRRCFNPDHLYSGTYSNNRHDTVEAGNDLNSNKTHCPYGHLYTLDNTYVYKNQRHCKTCHNERNRDYKASRRIS